MYMFYMIVMVVITVMGARVINSTMGNILVLNLYNRRCSNFIGLNKSSWATYTPNLRGSCEKKP